ADCDAEAAAEADAAARCAAVVGRAAAGVDPPSPLKTHVPSATINATVSTPASASCHGATVAR
ncbi:hypothetical protein ACXR2U_18545, partial [Jatrophihabitans sp. YIM 134969]